MRFVEALAILLAAQTAWASQELNYGLGEEASARTGGVVAEKTSPFAALYNPAVLSAQDASLFAFSSSGAGSSHPALKGVLLDSARFRTERGVNNTGDYEFTGFQQANWALGFTHPFRAPWDKSRRLGIGIVASGPFGKLRGFSASTPYDFLVLRYGTADAQFKATFGASLELVPNQIHLGVGASTFITAAGVSDLALLTNNPVGRFNLDVGLNTALIAGIYWQGEIFQRQQAVAFVFRQAVKPVFEQKIQGQVQIIEGTNSVVLPAVVSASLYQEPEAWEFEWQAHWGELTTAVGVSWQRWSGYRAPYLSVSTVSASRAESHTEIPAVRLNDTLNPRVSASWRFASPFSLSFGYQFRPSPVPDLSGPLNLLDSSAHILGMGLSTQLPAFMETPIWLGLYGQLHFLVARNVQKQETNYIGAPGYEFSGSAYSYGLSVHAAF